MAIQTATATLAGAGAINPAGLYPDPTLLYPGTSLYPAGTGITQTSFPTALLAGTGSITSATPGSIYMPYVPEGWTDNSLATPLSAARMSYMETGMVQIDTSQQGKAPLLVPTAVKTSAYTAAGNDLVPVDLSGGSVPITLPSAPPDKTQIGVQVVAPGFGNTATVLLGGVDVLTVAGGATSLSLAAFGEAVRLQYQATGAIWRIVAAASMSSLTSRVFRVGPTEYTALVPSGSTTGSYLLLDKVNYGDDASLLLRQGGVQKSEIGLASDNDFHIKAVTGASDAALTFTDALVVQNTTGYVNVPLRLGVGTVPAERLHVASSQPAARVLAKIENAAPVAGGNAASSGFVLAGQGHTWTFITDVGLNGNDNFSIQSGTAGFTPVIFCDATRNVGINGTSFGGGTGVVFLADATATPTSSPAGGGTLYSVSGTPVWRDASGNVTNLVTGSVHLAGAETITGVKTFSVAPVVPAASFPESAVTNLTSDLAAKAPNASPTFTGVVTVPHVVATGTAPTAAAGANNGTTPPAPVLTGADIRGKVTFGSGTTPAAGAQVVVTFASAFSAAPIVVLTPGTTGTQALGLFVSAVSTTAFTVSTTSAPAASQANTVFSLNYIAIG